MTTAGIHLSLTSLGIHLFCGKSEELHCYDSHTLDSNPAPLILGESIYEQESGSITDSGTTENLRSGGIMNASVAFHFQCHDVVKPDKLAKALNQFIHFCNLFF